MEAVLVGEEIGAAGFAAFEADDGAAGAEVFEELLADAGLDFAGAGAFVGDFDAGGDVDGGLLFIEEPLGDAAVGGEAGVEFARGIAVLIEDVAADDGAEAFDVEVGVLGFEGVEGPLDEVDAGGEGEFALAELEEAADAGVAVAVDDAHHLAVEKGPAAGFGAGDGDGEADHAVAVEGAEDLAADFGGDDEEADGE